MCYVVVGLSTAALISAASAQVQVPAREVGDVSGLYQQKVTVQHLQRHEVEGTRTDAEVGPLHWEEMALQVSKQPAALTEKRSGQSMPSVSDVCFLMLDVAYRLGKTDHASKIFGSDPIPSVVHTEQAPTTVSNEVSQEDMNKASSGERMLHVWHHDMFPDKRAAKKDGDEGLNFFRAAPLQDWIILVVACVFLCCLDWFVLRRCPETFLWHVLIVAQWIVWALVFNGIVWGRQGPKAAFEWATGYLLEWMLSMDNLFVFHLVFKSYKTPTNQIHKALFLGVSGAIVMRLLFFMVVSFLLRIFSWFRWPFGALLIYSGIEAARSEDDDDDDLEDTRLIRVLKWCLGSRLLEDYADGERCFIVDSQTGKWQATMLIIVVCCLEFADILFALDSVSAKVAQIPDQYVAFTSSVIAMYGLRAMFFIIKDLVEMFDMLKYGLCIILIFIGVELMFSAYLHLASSTVCILIIGVFILCIIGSKAMQRIKIQRSTSTKNLVKDPEQTIDKLIVKK